MAGLLSGEPSHSGAAEVTHKVSLESAEEGGGRWYFSRKEILENSPSRQDGIDLKKETYLRKSYCTFLQDLGMRLKVPQVTIASAIIFCHRFFLRQSHAKNDRRIIATVCMFLAGKVEETPRPLKDVILVSYEIMHKKDAAAVQRIKQKEVYERQKERVLLGEKIVLTTLGFDLNLHHPYKPLVEAIKKFKVAQNALAQVAWNFVNDGLRTSLCIQFKPHHIAAGAIFLAAKFLKVKLPSDGEKVWWQEFDVTPRQLEEVSNQMLELYEQNKVPQSHVSDQEAGAGVSDRPPSQAPVNADRVTNSQVAASSKASSIKSPPIGSVAEQLNADNHSGPPRITQTQTNDSGSSEIDNVPGNHKDDELNTEHHEQETMPSLGHVGEIKKKSGSRIDGSLGDGEEGSPAGTRGAVQVKDKSQGRNMSSKDGAVGQSPLDKEKIKAIIERRKALGDITRKDPTDELERELEDVEVPGESEKARHERKHNSSKSSNGPEHGGSLQMKSADEAEHGNHQSMKGQCLHENDFGVVEVGEVESLDNDVVRAHQSLGSVTRKRKPVDPLDRSLERKQRTDHLQGSHKQNYLGFPEERNGLVRQGYSERDQKRYLQENHV